LIFRGSMKNFISRSTTLLGLRICLLGLNDGFAVSWTHGGSREGSSCECREDGFVSEWVGLLRLFVRAFCLMCMLQSQ